MVEEYLGVKELQPWNHVKVLIQGKKGDLVMKAYLGDQDIHGRNRNTFSPQQCIQFTRAIPQTFVEAKTYQGIKKCKNSFSLFWA